MDLPGYKISAIVTQKTHCHTVLAQNAVPSVNLAIYIYNFYLHYYRKITTRNYIFTQTDGYKKIIFIEINLRPGGAIRFEFLILNNILKVLRGDDCPF